MTPAEAVTLYEHASADGAYVMWLITMSDRAHPGRAVAYIMVFTVRSGRRLSGELVASTIEDLRAILPAGLVRRARTALMPVGTVEAWD